MSSLIQELFRLIKVRKLVSSPYHPQTNGIVEKFNGTLKKMLKSYAVAEPSSWDRHLPYVLFAYREVPNETTGFSPFELLYGRQIRGPLAILKEHWEEPENSQESVLCYLLETRERLNQCSKLARVNEREAKSKQKVYYDRKARERKLEVGQKVLVLLPSNTSKLLAQWKGPFEITDKIGDVNYMYKVRVKRNKETIFHVNMLKPWFGRQDDSQVSEIVACLQVIQELNEEMEPETDFHVKSLPNLQANEGIGDINVASDLSSKQRRDLDRVLHEFNDVFSEVPKQTHLVQHSVKIEN